MEEKLTINPLRRFAHSRQNRVNHSACAKHIDLEHFANLDFFALFNSREIANAGIVHEYIDTTEFVLGRLDGSVDLAFMGDVELEHQRVSAAC